MLRKISLLVVFVLGFCGMTVQARAQRTWNDGDWTAWLGGPLAGGPIASLYDPNSKGVRNHYIGADQHVHELSFSQFASIDGLSPGIDASGDADLTALAGGPNAVGGIALIYGGFPQVFRSHYIAVDHHVHELYLDGSGWHDADLTAIGGGPSAFVPTVEGFSAPIASVYDPISNCIRIHYLADAIPAVPGAELHLHELLLDAKGRWHPDADLTAIWGGKLPLLRQRHRPDL